MHFVPKMDTKSSHFQSEIRLSEVVTMSGPSSLVKPVTSKRKYFEAFQYCGGVDTTPSVVAWSGPFI